MGIQNRGQMKRFFFIVIIMVLTSCSSAWHLKKAVKKGAELEQVTVPVYLYDTIIDTVDNKVIIRTIVKDTIWSVRNVVKYVPKTRVELRYDYKRFKDSLKYYRRMYSDSLKSAVKTTKIENRTERKQSNKSVRTLWLLVICGIIGIIAILLIKTDRL